MTGFYLHEQANPFCLQIARGNKSRLRKQRHRLSVISVTLLQILQSKGYVIWQWTDTIQSDDGFYATAGVTLLDKELSKQAALCWRPMGEGDWQKIDLAHVARAVYTGTFPPAQGLAIEYYLRVTTATGRTMLWPATAPALNQTVVVLPQQEGS